MGSQGSSSGSGKLSGCYISRKVGTRCHITPTSGSPVRRGARCPGCRSGDGRPGNGCRLDSADALTSKLSDTADGAGTGQVRGSDISGSSAR